MPSLRVATWNIAGARREQTNQVDLDAVVAGVRALGVDLLAVQEVDRTLARSGRSDQPAVIAQALGAGWFWSFAPALVGDDFRPLSGPDPGGPAYGNLLVSRLPLAAVEHLRFPPAGGGEQRTAILATLQVGSRPVTVAATATERDPTWMLARIAVRCSPPPAGGNRSCSTRSRGSRDTSRLP